MEKSMKFGQKDAELIKKIEQFQQHNNISSFAEAVRILCNLAIKYENVKKG